jgi:hypothetical protein
MRPKEERKVRKVRNQSSMASFQQYSHARWEEDFPQWSSLREDICAKGEPFDSNESSPLCIRYRIPSPANPENILWVVFSPEDIIVKYAVKGSHEHFGPDDDFDPSVDSECVEFWSNAYEDAISEFVRPVIEDQRLIVRYEDQSVLVRNVEEFLQLNQIPTCHYESWTHPPRVQTLQPKSETQNS